MILSASGGLVYHARAALSRIGTRDRWQPTRRAVSLIVRTWLAQTNPQTLIIFGPSAGYLLERDLFSSFSNLEGKSRACSLVCVDPDPLAALIFRKRFSPPSLVWHHRNDLLPFTSPAETDFSDFLKAQGPNTAILFLGLLGQLELHQQTFKRSRAFARELMLKALENFNWASLHDLESIELENSVRDPKRAISNFEVELLKLRPDQSQTERIEDLTRILNMDSGDSASLTPSKLAPSKLARTKRPSTKAWTDHETSWLGESSHYIPWLLSPRRFHLLGFSERTVGRSVGPNNRTPTILR